MKHFLIPIVVAGSLFAHAQASQRVSGETKGRTPSITMCILIDNSGSMSDKRAGVIGRFARFGESVQSPRRGRHCRF